MRLPEDATNARVFLAWVLDLNALYAISDPWLDRNGFDVFRSFVPCWKKWKQRNLWKSKNWCVLGHVQCILTFIKCSSGKDRAVNTTDEIKSLAIEMRVDPSICHLMHWNRLMVKSCDGRPFFSTHFTVAPLRWRFRIKPPDPSMGAENSAPRSSVEGNEEGM